ncbi:MAG: hypothetical protein ABIQ31_12705 [Ferruginibacter sp.]
MDKRVKVLFVVRDFWQAGAQRFAFEIDNAINKELFDIHILSYLDLNASTQFTDYYYQKHLDLGSHVSFLKNIVSTPGYTRRLTNRMLNNRLSNRLLPLSIRNKINPISEGRKIDRKKLSAFIKPFDVIGWMGEYMFSLLLPIIDDDIYNKSIIHIMNAKFQGIHVYDNFPKTKHYIFASGFDDEEQVRHEFSDFEHYKTVFFPLYLETGNVINNWHFKKVATIKKIGIFTRLDPMKPLDPFFYAFHLMLDKYANLELHIFGSGDTVKSGMQRFTEHLNIKDKVFFRGHSENIVETAKVEKMDLVWFQGYKNRPAGYAGFDICLSGVPQVLWDFSTADAAVADDSLVFPMYKNLNLFIQKSVEILLDEQTAIAYSNRQFTDVVENKNMKKKIHTLENLYSDISSDSIK